MCNVPNQLTSTLLLTANTALYYIICNDDTFDEAVNFCVQFDVFCAVFEPILCQFYAMSFRISVSGTVSPSGITELSSLLFSVYNYSSKSTCN
jgi:hypothetical protein